MNCCTICGLRISAGVHFVAGETTFMWADEPVQHTPSSDPRFLVLWLSFAGPWVPVEVAADAG